MNKNSPSNPGISHPLINEPISTTEQKKQLRRQMRRARQSLTPEQQATAAQQLHQRLVKQPLFLNSRYIAFYLANDGEINTDKLLTTALDSGKHCYLPTLDPSKENQLLFVRFEPGCPMQKNSYGIDEPVITEHNTLPAEALDLVLLPLVAFDSQGRRLGMGGGYYDRSFAFKHADKSARPCLLGLAHQCQQVPQLHNEHWDIPLHAVATDQQWVDCCDSGD